MHQHSVPQVVRPMVVALLLMGGSSPATQLYYTDFESFPVGDDHWAGTDGWLGTSVGAGVHGIDSNMVPALGKTAFLGYNRPSNTFVTVLKPISFNPVATNRPIMEFETLMGIQDSSNGRRDSFFFSFYNTRGDFLAAIRFSNEELTFGIWRLDGASQYDTGMGFVRNELHLLYARMDFSANRWSADLDGIPLFTNAVFASAVTSLTFGASAAEWQLSATNTAGYGNNWLLVADWSIRALPKGEEPFLVGTAVPDASGRPIVSWKGDKGFDYQVEYQDGAAAWNADLPASAFTNNLFTGTVTFVDATTPLPGVRKYRTKRGESVLAP